MDQQNVGCGMVLVLIGLGLIVAFWQYVLAMLLLVGLVLLLANVVAALSLAKLNSIVEAADKRFSGDVCHLGDGYAIIEQIQSQEKAGQARIHVLTARISNADDGFSLQRDQQVLTPPSDLNTIASNLAFSRYLEDQGIEMVNDLSVEAKATKAAMTCLQEAEWAQKSSGKIQGLIRSAKDTLAKAQGNELLEPSIPQLQEALSAFRSEEQKLNNYLDESASMLRKLSDFLSVPEAIRPILSFDLDDLFDPSRFKELEASFEEVVTLNEVFRELSRDKLS